jgi:hypothetical protein
MPAAAKVTCDIAMSVDGYTAGTDQRLDEPFGDGPRGTDLVTHLTYRGPR